MSDEVKRERVRHLAYVGASIEAELDRRARAREEANRNAAAAHEEVARCRRLLQQATATAAERDAEVTRLDAHVAALRFALTENHSEQWRLTDELDAVDGGDGA